MYRIVNSRDLSLIIGSSSPISFLGFRQFTLFFIISGLHRLSPWTLSPASTLGRRRSGGNPNVRRRRRNRATWRPRSRARSWRTTPAGARIRRRRRRRSARACFSCARQASTMRFPRRLPPRPVTEPPDLPIFALNSSRSPLTMGAQRNNSQGACLYVHS